MLETKFDQSYENAIDCYCANLQEQPQTAETKTILFALQYLKANLSDPDVEEMYQEALGLTKKEAAS